MFRYFGFGSNLNLTSLRAKGVEPRSFAVAELKKWRLCFNVQHFFKNLEGGVANIVYTGNAEDYVLGVVYECPDQGLSELDATEANGYGYQRITVNIETNGQTVDAFTYVGMPEFIDDDCIPCQRYVNILIAGATQAGLDSNYIKSIEQQPIYQPASYPEFIPPKGDFPVFDLALLREHPHYTALCGSVFDMSDSRPLHHFLKHFFGGQDMTLFHLKRMDSSDGSGLTIPLFLLVRTYSIIDRHVRASL